MKQMIIAMIITSLFAVGCDDESVVKGSLDVTIDYYITSEYAFGATDSVNPGSGKIYIMVWKTNTDFSAKGGRTNASATGELATVDGTASFQLKEGTYYVLAMYDYIDNGEGLADENEYYSFNGYFPQASDSDSVTISKETPASVNLWIGNDFSFDADAALTIAD